MRAHTHTATHITTPKGTSSHSLWPLKLLRQRTVVEATPWLKRRSAAGVAVSTAVRRPAIVTKVAMLIPLLSALAVGGGSGCNFNCRVKVIKPVCDGGTGEAAVGLAVIVKRSQVP